MEKYEPHLSDPKQFLQPAIELDEDEFWQQQSTGLALFIAEGFFRFYRVPIDLIELVVVSDRFHIRR